MGVFIVVIMFWKWCWEFVSICFFGVFILEGLGGLVLGCYFFVGFCWYNWWLFGFFFIIVFGGCVNCVRRLVKEGEVGGGAWFVVLVFCFLVCNSIWFFLYVVVVVVNVVLFLFIENWFFNKNNFCRFMVLFFIFIVSFI